MYSLIKNSIRILYTCIHSGFCGVYGWYKIYHLSGPVITIFGGRSAKKHSLYAQLAHEIAHQCVSQGKSIVTGGGPGVMEAANCGAYEQAHTEKTVHQHTLGIGVRDIDKGYINPCAPVIYMNTFFIRKWLFINYSSAFIFLPGGIGTADELFEVLNMIEMGIINPVPVILVDTVYWQPLINWYQQSGIALGLISPSCSNIFTVVDSSAEVMRILKG